MRITTVRLENIKSYVDQTIALTPGTNAIWGPNGSGKTTIVEAIGFALFDYLSYGQKAFLRESEAAGSIRVRVIALDEREYEVVRQIGVAKAHFVYDLDLNHKIASSTKEVMQWVRQNVAGGDEVEDLEFLFLNALGVPQGLMTATFRQPPAARKPTFDKLLGLQEYADTATKLRDTESLLKGQVSDFRERIGRYEGETSRLPQVEEELGILHEQRTVEQASLHALAGQLQDTERKLALFEAARVAREDALRLVDACTATFAIRQANLSSAERELNQSRVARDALERSTAGYEEYLRALAELERLDPLREARDRISAESAESEGRLKEVAKTLERLRLELNIATEAERATQRLQPQVDELQQKEIQHRDALDAVRRYEELAESREQREVKCARVEAELGQSMEEIESVRAQQDGERTLTELEAALETARTDFLQAEQAEKRALELSKERTALLRDIAAIEGELAPKLTALAELGGLRAVAQTMPQLIQLERTSDSELREVALAIQYQDIARRELQKQQCPLLTIPCPASSDGLWVRQRFESRIGSLIQSQNAIAARYEEARVKVAEAEKDSERLRVLELSERDVEHLRARLQHQRTEVARLAAQEEELGEVWRHKDDLLEKGKKLRVDVEAERDRAGRILTLELTIKSAATQLAELRKEVADLSSQIDPLTGAKAEAKRLDEWIGSKTDMKQEYDLAVTASQTKSALESQIEARQRELDELEGLLEASRRALQQYADLDALLSQARSRRDTHQTAYEQYLTCKSDSDALGDREIAVSLAGAELGQAQQDLRSAQSEASRTSEAYDEGFHDLARSERDRVIAARAEATSRVSHLDEDVTRHEAEIESLRTRLQFLHQARSECMVAEQTARDIAVIREVMKGAGPAITEQLVQSVSGYAGQIFGDIMDDHTLDLRWQKDYDIVVRHGGDDRPFVQLSGGEQMSAAIAVRLALIKQISEVGVAFFDEPTQNMDLHRRTNLAEQIEKVTGFEQLIVISHDDSFEHHTDNLIRLEKEQNQTVVAG